MAKTIILSLGGSIINPGRVDTRFLKAFRTLILSQSKKGYRFVIVTGGGSVCREYQKAALSVDPRVGDVDLDLVGISATKMNAELIRALFGKHAHYEVLQNPAKRVITNKKILIGAGWKPGSSSDKDAVILAQTFDADLVINMSNISFVYSADPKKVKHVTPIARMSWNELLKITGRRWSPGAHQPFDPEASKLAQQLGIKAVICLGTDLRNLRAVITGGSFIGTVIS